MDYNRFVPAFRCVVIRAYIFVKKDQFEISGLKWANVEADMNVSALFMIQLSINPIF